MELMQLLGFLCESELLSEDLGNVSEIEDAFVKMDDSNHGFVVEQSRAASRW